MAFENLKSTGIKYLLEKLKGVFVQIKDAIRSVNGEFPDDNGDILLRSVPYAQNIESESSNRVNEAFIQRTTGGSSSVQNGDAWLTNLKGNNRHDNYVAESIDMTITHNGGDDPIGASLDRDTFVSYVQSSGTIVLTYTTGWSADPAYYGITITGTPVSGDVITIVYVKENRGTIYVANPQTFVSTGWNLYDNSAGYAKVVKYGYSYRVSGTYTDLKFSATLNGTKTTITPVSGAFDVPSDGYVWVTGGNTTDTAIYPVWEDWTAGYVGDFAAYSQTVVDLSTIMSTYFPYGLLKAGSVVDELDLNLGHAISRVERLGYTSMNLATAKASGREYEYDENYIYLARASAVQSSISLDASYTANDHGIEYFTVTECDVDTETLYGNNLRNKLERDVLTISSQTLSSGQKSQVQSNIGLIPSEATDISSAGYVADARVIKTINGKMVSVDWTPANGDTILGFINTIDKAYLPCSFVKRGTVTPSDCPFASDEFTGIVCGNGDRVRVTIKPYKSANNNQEYSRDIWQNGWLENGWDILNTWRPIVVKEYTCAATRTVAEGAMISIAAQDLKDGNNNAMSCPTGYVPFGVTYVYPGSSNIALMSFDASASGSDIAIIYKAISAFSGVSMTTKLNVAYIAQ